MSEATQTSTPPVHIITYGSGVGSEKPRSAFAPEALRRLCHGYFGDVVAQWKRCALRFAAREDNQTALIKNRPAVEESLKELFTETCTAQWQGGKSLAIGGDHSQGFATMRATLTVACVKAMLDGSIQTTPEIKEKIQAMAQANQWMDIVKYIDSCVDENKINVNDIKKITDRIGVLWIDAHGDFNTTETSTSRNFHGMSSAAACGMNVDGMENLFGKFITLNPKNIHLLCSRDLDETEEELLTEMGVHFEAYRMDKPDHPTIRAANGGGGGGGNL